MHFCAPTSVQPCANSVSDRVQTPSVSLPRGVVGRVSSGEFLLVARECSAVGRGAAHNCIPSGAADGVTLIACLFFPKRYLSRQPPSPSIGGHFGNLISVRNKVLCGNFLFFPATVVSLCTHKLRQLNW